MNGAGRQYVIAVAYLLGCLRQVRLLASFDRVALVRTVFSSWQRGGEPAKVEIPQVPVPSKPQTIDAPVANRTQVDIALGFPGISRRDPKFYEADLMNYLLGASFMSRLNMRIREELGLAYYVMFSV